MAAKKLRSKSAPQLTKNGLRSSSAATVISDETKDRIEQEAQDIYQKYYTQQNDPAKAGSDAFRRAVATQLRQSYEQQRRTGES